MDSSRIAAIPLFSDLSVEQQQRLAEAAGTVEFDAGATLAQEGDFGFAMFALEDGTAQVVRNGETLGTLGPGDVFGEAAVLSGGRRTASVVATTPVRAIALINRDVWRLERESPDVVEALRRVIAARLEHSD